MNCCNCSLCFVQCNYLLSRWCCVIGTCPNSCSGHGDCTSMYDMSILKGPDYLPALSNSGDGLGIPYTNWDQSSITLCNCDSGYFGADCSLIMCPRSDDPWTREQNDREINLLVTTNTTGVGANTTGVALGGILAIKLYGSIAYLNLTNPSDTQCQEGLQNSSQIGTVECDYNIVSEYEHNISIRFTSWPSYTPDNNVYINNGNPDLVDFFCDVSQTDPSVECFFSDLVSDDIKGRTAD